MRFSDIQLSDKELWLQAKDLWRQSKYSQVFSLFQNEQLNKKILNAKALNDLLDQMVSHFSTKRLHIIDALNQIENDIPLEEYGCIKGFASQNVEDMFMLLALKPGKEIITKYGIWERIKKYRLTVLFDHNSSKRVRGYALLSYLGRNVSTLIYNKYQDIKWNCNHEV